jgi:methyl coenzyme M reductase subunit C
MKKINYITVILLLFTWNNIKAQTNISTCTEASPYPVEITQPDDSKLIVVGKGNILNNHVETEDGYTIVKNSSRIVAFICSISK